MDVQALNQLKSTDPNYTESPTCLIISSSTTGLRLAASRPEPLLRLWCLYDTMPPPPYRVRTDLDTYSGQIQFTADRISAVYFCRPARLQQYW